ncbi:putative phage tail assembly chaperone [Ursidibacter sp. B-7004-1]
MKTAKELLESLQAKNKTTISIGGVEFTFNLDNAAYDAMINSFGEDNKVTPVKDYLLDIVDSAQKEEFAELLQVPGLALQIAGKVNAALIPKVEITVKN